MNQVQGGGPQQPQGRCSAGRTRRCVRHSPKDYVYGWCSDRTSVRFVIASGSPCSDGAAGPFVMASKCKEDR